MSYPPPSTSETLRLFRILSSRRNPSILQQLRLPTLTTPSTDCVANRTIPAITLWFIRIVPRSLDSSEIVGIDSSACSSGSFFFLLISLTCLVCRENPLEPGLETPQCMRSWLPLSEGGIQKNGFQEINVRIDTPIRYSLKARYIRSKAIFGFFHR